MPQLFLRALSEAHAVEDEDGYEFAVEWLIREDDGSIRGSGSTDFRGLSDVADPNTDWLADPDNTVVFIPSQFVLMLDCEVPGRNAGQIRRALPFAVEEYVASDIETMHIAHGDVRVGEPVTCHVISQHILEGWLECFSYLGINPGWFVADAGVLPGGENEASALFERNTVVVSGMGQAAVVDRANIGFALGGLGAQKIYAINGSIPELVRGQLETAPDVEEVALPDHGILQYFAEQFLKPDSANSHINLLQGAYQPARRVSKDALKWRSVGVLAAVWLVVAFLGMVVQAWWAQSEAERLRAESFDFYASLFPDESQPVSAEQLRRRMRAKLGMRGGAAEAGSDFVGLTAHLSNTISTGHLLESLSYTDQRRELTAEVILGSYDDLEVIKGELARVGVTVDVANAEQEGQRVRSRLRVRYEGVSG